MRLERYTAENAAAWNGFAAAAKNAHFMHQRGYMEYHTDRFTDHSVMAYDDDNRLCHIRSICHHIADIRRLLSKEHYR